MPPHCDTLDGPVVMAAKKALEAGNVDLILPWAPKEAEGEIRNAFSKAIAVRKLGKEAEQLADFWFFETVVRLHRAGEGAPFTGLKPAGLPQGPVLPLAEEALAAGNAKQLIDFLSKAVEQEINEKLHHALHKKKNAAKSIEAARAHVSAVLGFELYSHHLYEYMKASGKEHGEEEGSEKEHSKKQHSEEGEQKH